MTAAAWFAIAMALLSFVVWVAARVLFPDRYVDPIEREYGDEL